MASPPQSGTPEATTSRSPATGPSVPAVGGGQSTTEPAIEPALEVAPYDVRILP